MRLILLIISLSLVLQLQNAAGLLCDCLSPGNTFKMELPVGSACGCEHEGNLPMMPAARKNCPNDCMNCNLEAHAADILLSLPSIPRKVEVNRAIEAALNMSVAEWIPDPLDILSDAETDVPPQHCPMTEWGVWRL